MAESASSRGGDARTFEPQTPFLRGRRGEGLVFALLAVLAWPVIAVAVVGGYGFMVWMYQILTGPPGPPAG